MTHDNHIGNFNFVSTDVTFGGNSIVYNNCFIGLNSTIKSSIEIHDYSLIGSASNVLESTIKKGVYVPCHLHFNVTYLAEADEVEVLVVNEEENQAVKWFTFDEALEASSEPWMVEHVYKKLIEKCR